MTEFKAIREAIKKEYSDRYKEAVSRLETTNEYHKTKEDVLNHFVRWSLNKREDYKGTYEEQKAKALHKYSLKLDRELKKELDFISDVENATDDFKEFYITIEWKKSYTWGYNPNAEDCFGNTSGSIGGCGYCKKSTATARILNQHLEILKRMYALKEKELSHPKKEYFEQNGRKEDSHRAINHTILNYGSGYGIKPTFEGGVGVSSHQTILECVGLRMEHVSDTKTTDVYRVYEVKNEEKND
jgi:hypothetical protein